MSTSGSQSHLVKGCLRAQSYPTLCNPMGMGFPTKNTGVGCHFLLQGIFPTQGLKPRLLHLRRRQWHSTPVLLPGKSQGQRSLIGCSPWGCYEADTTEWLQVHFSLSCIGEGNGNPLQCSCLENPRDGGAWWAAVYGIAQSRTWLKRFSSSSISCIGR